MTSSHELATVTSTRELEDIERHVDTKREIARRALPPVVEWGPKRHRDDFETTQIDTPDLNYSA